MFRNVLPVWARNTMGMREFYGTADMYGLFTNDRLVGRAIAGRRKKVVIATKFGNELGEDGSRT